MNCRKRQRGKQGGMSLLEVLIAVVVLAIGLLGLAGLQVRGLRNVSETGTHAQAVILANELVERIHLNSVNASDYTTLPSSCTSPSTTKDIDYCEVLMKARGDLNGDGTTDSGGIRLLREYPSTSLFSIAACGGCGSTGLYTLTVSWAEKDLAGIDQTVTYGFNFMP
ncbi:MAG: type IV pilus modification protein PilV [Sedimenticola sp.]